VGVVDLTRGELGTRGTIETRAKEAADSAKILGLTVRENLGLPDGFFRNEREHQLEVVKAIRKFQPEIVLGNAIYDRHPDHGRASDLIFESCFLSGLLKVSTSVDGQEQKPWKPKALYHYIQSQFLAPDFVVDVTDHWEKKMESIRAFRTQFYDPNNKEPDTYISSPAFLKLVESRANELGHSIGAKYGEGFTVRRFIGVNSLFDLR
jgi:bacillithiol biosynthesis deacetylase BshB1